MPPAPSPRSSRSFFGMGMIGQTMAHANGIVNTIERLGATGALTSSTAGLGRSGGAYFMIRAEQVATTDSWGPAAFTWDLGSRASTSQTLPKVLTLWIATLTVLVTTDDTTADGAYMEVSLPDHAGDADWPPTNRGPISIVGGGVTYLSVCGASAMRIPDVLSGSANVVVGTGVAFTVDAALTLQPPAGSI